MVSKLNKVNELIAGVLVVTRLRLAGHVGTVVKIRGRHICDTVILRLLVAYTR